MGRLDAGHPDDEGRIALPAHRGLSAALAVFVDSHAHLDMLDDVDAALARARDAGVTRVVTIGVDLATSERAVEQARALDGVAATVGLHPHDAKDWTDETMARLAALATDPAVVGVGEAGLDYHYDNSPREQQRAVFAEHVRIATAAGKALVIHSREAWDDTFSILVDEGVPERFMFHCFSGGPDEAERALALGAVLSFSGIVTFPNADALREAARVAPLDRILVETDSPFLTPVPYRGRRNEPAHVVHVAEQIATTKGVAIEEVAAVTSRTAARLFGWPSV